MHLLNGIDLGRFPYNGPCPHGPVVTVARLSPEKDVANLVRATAIAACDGEDLRIEVACGGECLDELKRLAAELGVCERVVFLGEVRDVSALLARGRMFVLPSRSEGFPLTVLGAMARGLPVVATRVSGLLEVVDDGVTGLLVPPADPAALAGAMVEIWTDPNRCGRMGHAGRQCAEERFDVRRMLAQYEELYREEPGGDRYLDGGRKTASTTPAPAESSTSVE